MPATGVVSIRATSRTPGAWSHDDGGGGDTDLDGEGDMCRRRLAPP